MDLVYTLVLKHCLNLQRRFRAMSERCQDRRSPPRLEPGTFRIQDYNVTSVQFRLIFEMIVQMTSD
jgi:hypothetical protein